MRNIKKYKKEIEIIIVSFMCYFLAHGYAFNHNLISHDSLAEFEGGIGSIEHKIQLGRFLVPIYQAIFREHLTNPWIIGILGFLFLSLAIVIVTKIFNVKNKIIALTIPVIMVCNLTLTSEIGTYTHQFDASMLALLCSVGSVYIWNNNEIFLFGSLLIAIMLGIYQSYISVVMTLIVFVVLLRLLKGIKLKEIAPPIIKAILMITLGAVIYYALMKLSFVIMNVDVLTSDNNSISNINNLSPIKIIYGFIETYIATIYNMVNPTKMSIVSTRVIARVMLLVAAIIVGVKLIINRKLKTPELLFAILLIAFLPIFMNVTRVISGYSHMIMHYAIWLIYIFALVLIDEYDSSVNKIKKIKICVFTLVFILAWNNIIISNKVYQKKFEEQNATLSLMTRVVYLIESQENYKYNETPIVFIGKPDYLLPTPEEYNDVLKVTGAQYPSVLGTCLREYYQKYFKYILRSGVVIADEDTWYELQNDEKINKMSSYPSKDAVQIINGICVVKFEK